jgi:nucleoside-diphosphate-sugar epimerase
VGLYTLFGGFGFVGTEIAAQLEAEDNYVKRVGRENWPEPGTHLGHVVFCIGMTADFRKRLIETFEIQVLRLQEALVNYHYDSFLYLSSARVYNEASSTHENAPLIVRPMTSDHVYNISKIAGESLCLAYDNPKIRVARLSNVYGSQDTSNLFMTAVVREAVEKGEVTIGQAPESSKDYIVVQDAAKILIAISRSGQERLYNVACGSNFTHKQIAVVLENNGFTVHFKTNSPVVTFPEIDTTRAKGEFNYMPTTPASQLPDILNHLKLQTR